jgi:hypothetical protein
MRVCWAGAVPGNLVRDLSRKAAGCRSISSRMACWRASTARGGAPTVP